MTQNTETLDLTILIPCLNEIKTLSSCIEKAHQACSQIGIKYEVLVSDNGSTDGSIEVAKKLGARVVPASRRGYGAALLNGFDFSKGNYILFADADDTYDFSEVARFWSETNKGHKVVIGTRIGGNIHKGAMPFLNRYLGTPILTFLIRLLYGIEITDCNSGMRLLEKNVYQSLNMRSPGMEYASEMLVKLGLLQIPIKEIPIDLWPDRRGRPPHLRRWRDGWRHLRFILMYAPDKILSRPGFAFFLIGALGVISLGLGPLQINGKIIGYHFQIAFATLGLVGLIMWGFGQIISFFSHVSKFVGLTKKRGFLAWPLEMKVSISALLTSFGCSLDTIVILKWFEQGFSDVQELHFFITGLFFIVSGLVGMLLALTFFTFEYEQST